MEYWQSSPCKICSAWVFFVALDIFLGVTRGTSQDEINKHLMMGGEMLARGNLQDALSHFHAAVEGDPKNYLTYFKRGTVYLAMAKAKFAILDLNKVLELKPDFTGARYQRAQVLLKQGNLKAAKDDFLYIYQLENNGDAYSNYIKAENLQSDIATAEAYIRDNDYVSAVNLLTSIIEACPWSSYLRELRSQCYVALNEPVSAILDLRSTTKLQSDNTDGLYKLAILYYQLGQAPESLREVRECLKLDPEHKDCFPHYKKVKKVAKFMIDAQEAAERKDYDTCISSASKILKTETKVPMIKFAANTRLCSCYLHDGRYGPSIDACTDALNINRDPEVLCDRAEAYTENEMYDEALRDYYEVVDGNGNYHQRAKEGIQKVQKLQKQSEKRDYYKILGVKRSATKREIIKAYRKAAQQWHPDNFPEGAEKKAAEKKFIDIAAAKEVLTNEDKRAKFDQGEDPLDPESGNHQGFNPFQEFHHFHSGTPFTFKFHFN